VRAPSARSLGIAAAVVGVLALLYLAARETPLFAVRELVVTGAPPDVREAVREAAKPFLGESLVALDGDEVRRTLEAIPTVRSLEVDRAFPNTLRITVSPERPLALLRSGQSTWLVSDRGRVMEEIARGRPAHAHPRIPIGQRTAVRPGELLETASVRVALGALRRIPDDFPVRIRSAWVDGQTVTLVLAGGTELRLGDRDDLALKLGVAGRVLRTLAPGERRDLAYLDVTVPERPVGASKAQLSTLG
jgi:cell division protein FtsQ